MGCNCNKTPPQQVYYSQKVAPLVATNCEVTLSQVLAIKQNLLDKKTPQNAAFVNSKLGLIETMINHQNYCLSSLNEMVI